MPGCGWWFAVELYLYTQNRYFPALCNVHRKLVCCTASTRRFNLYMRVLLQMKSNVNIFLMSPEIYYSIKIFNLNSVYCKAMRAKEKNLKQQRIVLSFESHFMLLFNGMHIDWYKKSRQIRVLRVVRIQLHYIEWKSSLEWENIRCLGVKM